MKTGEIRMMSWSIAWEGNVNDSRDKYRGRSRDVADQCTEVERCDFAGSVGTLGEGQTGNWHLRSEARDGVRDKNVKTELTSL